MNLKSTPFILNLKLNNQFITESSTLVEKVRSLALLNVDTLMDQKSFFCERHCLKHLFFLILFTFLVPVTFAYSQETICHKYVVLNPTQEPAMGPRCRVVGDVFYFDGAVTEDLFYELRDFYPNVKTIELNSYGGLVEAGYKIAELVRERGISTNVRKDARCASACTLIYQAGVHRSAHPTVRFLYHGARLSSDWFPNWLDYRYEFGRQKGTDFVARQIQEVQEETEKFFSKMISYGMNPDFIKYYRSLPESKTWFQDGNFTRTQDLIIAAPKLINYQIVQDFDFRTSVPE